MDKNHIKMIRDFYRSADDIIEVSNDNAVYGISKIDPHYKATVVRATGYNEQRKLNVDSWRNVVKIRTESINAMGLTADGKLVTSGDTWCYRNEDSDLNVGSWSGIRDFTRSHASTAAIKEDGTVITAGSNDYNERNVSGFNNIIQLVSGIGFTAGLRADGTVAFAGVDDVTNQKEGLSPGRTAHSRNLLKDSYDTSSWNHIVRLYSEPDMDSLNERLYGLREDGTVLATGSLYSYQHVISHWTDIIDLFAYHGYMVGIKRDGSIVTTYTEDERDQSLRRDLLENANQLTNVVYAIPRVGSCVFLKADGTVVGCGLSAETKNEIRRWKNIVAIKYLGDDEPMIIGLKANGEVVQSSYATRRTSDDEAMSNDLASGVYKDYRDYERHYTVDTSDWKLKSMELDAYILAFRLISDGDPKAALGLLKTIDYFANASELLTCGGRVSFSMAVNGARQIHDAYNLGEFYTVFEHKTVFEKLYELLNIVDDYPEAKRYAVELKNEQQALEQKLLSERERMQTKIADLKREYSGLSAFSIKKKKEIKKEIESCETYLSVLNNQC